MRKKAAIADALYASMQETSTAALLAKVAPTHHRLALEIISIVTAAGYLTATADQLVATAAVDVAAATVEQLESKREQLRSGAASAIAANVELIWACMQSLPDILTGKVKVPDVMFPGGSSELVEPIYKNPLLSAPFNEQLAEILVDYVTDRLQVRL